MKTLLLFLALLSPQAQASSCEWETLVASAEANDVSGLQAAHQSCPDLVTRANTKNETLLFFATQANSVNVMTWLLSNKAEANARASDGCSALCHASSLEAVELLLTHGASVKVADRLGRPAFFHLLETKNWALLDRLLEAGAMVGLEEIEWASAYIKTDILSYLAERALPETIAGSGKYFKNFFFHEESQRRIAKILIAKGADLNRVEGKTLLENYVKEYVINGPQYKRNGLTAMRFLLENGASANSIYTGIDIPNLFFALAWKTEEPAVAEEILSLFLRHGFDPQLRSPGRNKTLLMEIASITAMSPQKQTYAEGMIRSLLAKGFDPQAQCAQGRTALHWAIQTTNSGAGRALAQVTDLSLKDSEGKTAEEFLLEQMRYHRNSPPYLQALSEILQVIRSRR